MILLWLACAIDPPGPASPGSVSSEEAAAVATLAGQASEIEALAKELTSLIDESRRQVADGRSTKEQEIAKMRELMKRIEEQNTTLQAEMTALEERVHTRAGDPTWPPEEVKKR